MHVPQQYILVPRLTRCVLSDCIPELHATEQYCLPHQAIVLHFKSLPASARLCLLCTQLHTTVHYCTPMLPTARHSTPLLATARHRTPLLATVCHCSPLHATARQCSCIPLHATASQCLPLQATARHAETSCDSFVS